MGEERGIPNGWTVASVQDIAEVVMGQSPPSATYNTDKIGLPFFQGKAEFTQLHPVAEKWCSKPNRIAISDDILLSVRAPVGVTNVADRECCIGRGLAAVKYHHNHKFIYFFLCLIERELDEQGTGTTFRAISGEVIRNTRLPLPPLSEQHRIVAKIEELFSSLDKGIESLKTAQQQLKVYRQAVLKWAFEGKLTNKNVVDGKLPMGWKTVKFGTVFSESPQNGLYKSSANYGSGTRIVRIDGFYEGKLLFDYKYKNVRLTQDEIERYRISVGNILINRVNSLSHLGKCGFVEQLKEETVFESNIMKIIVDKSMADAKYISIYLSSINGLAELRKNAKHAVNQASINQKDVSNVLVPLASLSEQHTIVAEIESRLSVCDKIEETIEQSLKQAESLRQSILKKAFEGKLVPQDPNDEPASVLLERIRLDKSKKIPEKKTKTLKRKK
jgi:type I restriction enzyme S subunit